MTITPGRTSIAAALCCATVAGFRFAPSGELIDEATWTHKHTGWLPTQQDRDYVTSCMKAVREPGKFANYIAPPAQGANNQPAEFEYVKFH